MIDLCVGTLIMSAIPVSSAAGNASAMMSMLPISITPLMKAMIWNWTLPTALHASGFGRRRRRKSGCGFMLTHAEGIRYRKYQ